MSSNKTNNKPSSIRIYPPPSSTPTSSASVPSTSFTHNQSYNLATSFTASGGVGSSGSGPVQFHRRKNSTIPVPKPSHKPPSSSHSFRGDIKSQDVFAAAFKKRNDKLIVLFPGEPKFEMERVDMWNHDSICTPCLILQPRTNKEVSDCLVGYDYGIRKCISTNRKLGTKLVIPRLAIAGGRNSINAMRSGSIVLDMSKMRCVRVNSKAQLCKVQGGARIIELDAALSEYGFIAVTGTQQNVGVVGCVLGGGYGYASRKYGMACENVLKVEVVLADGSLKACSRKTRPDLFYSICGGGGGVGIVVSLTLKCYPLVHAALLTYDLPTIDLEQRRTVLRHWANWINGDVDKSQGCNPKNLSLRENDGTHKEVYSQLMLPTDSSTVKFLGTSIDDNVIPQSGGFIERYEEAERKAKRRGKLFKFGKSSSAIDEMKQYSWENIPGLADLVTNKFGVSTRNHVQYRMLRYADQLQSLGSDYFTSGNVYIAMKYAESLSDYIIEILVQATLGEKRPNNGSRIYIHSLGGEISEHAGKQHVSFNARHMKYIIFIEGSWEAVAEHKYAKEKEKVKEWVNWVVKQLHVAKGTQSTAHPESMRDQVSRSGKTKPSSGWYNFDEVTGKRLAEIKSKRDPRSVFCLASRISWQEGSRFTPVDTNLHVVSNQLNIPGIKNNKGDSIDSFTPTDLQEESNEDELVLHAASTTDTEDLVGDFEESDNPDENTNNLNVDFVENVEVAVAENGNEEESSITSDLKRLLSMTDSEEDDFKNWSFNPDNFEGGDYINCNESCDEDLDQISPKSVHGFNDNSSTVKNSDRILASSNPLKKASSLQFETSF